MDEGSKGDLRQRSCPSTALGSDGRSQQQQERFDSRRMEAAIAKLLLQVYASSWVDVKDNYNLTVTASEKSALSDMLSTC